MPRMARIGVLTGGGDCPGLNAVIRGIVRAGVKSHGHSIVGFRYGWAGVVEDNAFDLTPENTAGILPRGGTILGSSRTNPYREGGGETDAFGHERLGGIAVTLEKEIESRTGYETRMTILGHVQRGGTPTAYDRVLATRFGVEAVGAATDGDHGRMVALRGTEIVRVPLADALAEPKLVDPAVYETAEVFFG